MKNRVRGRLSHGNQSKMISIRFPVELLARAKQECKEDGLAFSSVLIGLVEKWIEEKKDG